MRPTMSHTIVFSLLLLLLSVGPVWGKTYYVKAGGNDGATGTSDGTAWATTAKVTATVTSGDIVYFRSQDTWEAASGPLVLKAIAGVTYIGNVYGSGTRATFKAHEDTLNYLNSQVVQIFESNVVIRGFNIDMNGKRTDGIDVGRYAGKNIDNNVIDNCVIHDNYGTQGVDWMYGILVGSTDTPVGYAITNTTITNNNLYNTWHEGVAVYSGWANANNRSDNTLIAYNTINNCQAGVEIANHADHVTVEHNTITNASGLSAMAIVARTSPTNEGYVTSGPENMVIRYNYIANNAIGLEFYDARTLVMSGDVYNNIFYNNCPSGTYCGDIYLRNGALGGVDWYFPAGTVFNFYNNSIYNNNANADRQRTGAVLIGVDGGATCSSATVNFKNNIIHVGPAITNAYYYPLWDRCSEITNSSHSNNLIYRESGGTVGHVFVSFPYTTYDRNGGAADLTNWEPTAKKTDPLFISTVTPDFHLQASSPAINAGVDIGLRTDYLGNAIVGLPDIGAYEFQSSSKQPPGPTGIILTP